MSCASLDGDNMNILDLPADVIIFILHFCDVGQLASLCQTCRVLYDLVEDYGWASYLRRNPRLTQSLSRTRSLWDTKTQVRYDVLSDRAWNATTFIARPLSRPWHRKAGPTMVLNKSRLLVGVGSTIYSYRFGTGIRPSIAFEGSIHVPGPASGKTSSNNFHEIKSDDITSLTILDDGIDEDKLIIGRQFGGIELVSIEELVAFTDAHPAVRDIVEVIDEGISRIHAGDLVESVSSNSSLLLSLSSGGQAKLQNFASNDSATSRIGLGGHGWTCFLSDSSYAAFGTTSKKPLSVHLITEAALLPKPSRVLCPKGSPSLGDSVLLDDLQSSAVYGISRAPPFSPWGSSSQVIASGWYDGRVRCFDLRMPSTTMLTNSRTSILEPVMILADPWSYDPIYSLSCGGGSGAHIAAGSARHSVISFWDVRYAGSNRKSGWSVHAPGNDESPVHGVILDSSRLFGATERRPFIYDFGPDVSLSSYPSLPSGRIDGLKPNKGGKGSGYYVTKYSHKRATAEPGW